jgi:hypothetical protein
MGLPPEARRHFAQKHIEAAQQHLASVEDAVFHDSRENLRAYERFYNNLALFSGGTIALSVTYLGYLKTVSKVLQHRHLLSASWIALFVCLVCSLLWVFFNLHYAHHAGQRTLCEAEKRKFETEAADLPAMGLKNIQTASEVAAIREPREKAAHMRAENAEWHGKRENRYRILSVWSGRVARACFVGGIGMLLWFAIMNS